MIPYLRPLFAGAILILACSGSIAGGPCGDESLRILTLNAWGAGGNDGTDPTATIEVLRAADADVVALQEARAEYAECTPKDCPAAGQSAASFIAQSLGYHVYEPPASPLNWANALLTRYPVVSSSPLGVGVMLDVCGAPVAVFNVHLDDAPYQPYQAAGIPYGDAPFTTDPGELVMAARSARGAEVALLEQELEFAECARLTVIAGDFNEPSHRDWSVAAVAAGLHPVAVDYPSVRTLEKRGFVDVFRAVHPDEVARPGHTWTPKAAVTDPQEHHDRIDYLLARGEAIRITGAWVVGESAENADIVIQPWPSDHRGVVADIVVEADSGPVNRCSEFPAQSP